MNDHHGLPSELMHVLFEHASDAFFVLDPEGGLVFINQTACDLLDYSRSELLQLSMQDIISPAYANDYLQRIQTISDQGDCTFEAEYLKQDGTGLPVEIHARRIDHPQGSHILYICRDIRERKATELTYRSIVQASADGFWALRASDGKIIDVNEAFCRMLGYSRSELLNMHVADIEADESADDITEHIKKIIEKGWDLFERRHRHKQGHLIDVEISIRYAPLDEGLFFSFVREISQRKEQEAEAKMAGLIFNASQAAILVTDEENKIITVNPAFARITGYSAEEALGKNPRFLGSGRNSRVFYRQVWESLHQHGYWEGDWWNRHKSGHEYAEQVSLNVVRDKQGKIFRYVKISTDITQKKQLEELVWKQAHYDTVTQLPNRQLFLAHLDSEVKQAGEKGYLLALYFIDLDGFKQVNDVHGHDAGDELLFQAGQRIANCIRSTDMVARLGGDEFTVLLSDLQDSHKIMSVGRQFLQQLVQPFALSVSLVQVSASIGVALFPQHATDGSGLMKLADQAMYEAKNAGKNTLRSAAELESA